MNAEIYKNKALENIQASQYKEALINLDNCLAIHPDNPEIWYHQAYCYRALKSYQEAAECLKKVIQALPNLDIAWNALGLIHYEVMQFPQALECFDRAIKYRDTNFEAWINKCKLLLDQKKYLAASEALQHAYSLNPNYDFLLGDLVFTKLILCDWDGLDELQSRLINSFSTNQKTTGPFELLSLSSTAEFQKIVSQEWVKHKFIHITRLKQNLLKKEKIRIAYFSSDFRVHPVGLLINEILPHHNRSEFEIYGFFLNSKIDDEIELSISKQFNKSFDIANINDDEAYKIILDQNLDIAIDLNGHTSGNRMSLFARGIAPIQINYLGYPGTCGSQFHDFLIADDIVIPESEKHNYCEKIAYLPNSFFPAKPLHAQLKNLTPPSRISQKLPSNSFIFGCFNNSYKIHPTIFSIWMDLLNEIRDSVLWLSIGEEAAQINLKKQASSKGIDPSRIIFAGRESLRINHLNRIRLIDLFLDTPNYNAHVTTSDVLSVGVPVLTILGNTFAGRVAASQLKAIGLSEMITNRVEEYKHIALELASDRKRLEKIRSRLIKNISYMPLFDTSTYVNNLESLFKQIVSEQN